jgi:hypothetical protein
MLQAELGAWDHNPRVACKVPRRRAGGLERQGGWRVSGAYYNVRTYTAAVLLSLP